MNEELLEIVKQVRSERVSQIGLDKYKDESDALMGRCRKNSIQLAEELSNNGYSTRIGGGVIKSGMWSKNEPDSFQDAINRKAPIHYWVEVDRMYICELASESDLHYGEPIAVCSHPEQLGYVVFEDSYDGYEKRMC